MGAASYVGIYKSEFEVIFFWYSVSRGNLLCLRETGKWYFLEKHAKAIIP
jgi:hypothetical protein